MEPPGRGRGAFLSGGGVGAGGLCSIVVFCRGRSTVCHAVGDVSRASRRPGRTAAQKTALIRIIGDAGQANTELYPITGGLSTGGTGPT
jgi:hypothetical protein